MEQEQQKKAVKKRFSKPVIAMTFILQLLVSIIICVAVVFYTPFFQTLKKFYISSAMQTRTQQYLARIFFSDKEINDIIGKGKTVETGSQQVSNIKATKSGDPGIAEYAVSGSLFNGYVLEINDPKRIKVAMTRYVGKVGEFTSTMAKVNNAIAAINGGGYSGGANWSDSAQSPDYFVIQDGKVTFMANNWDDSSRVNTVGIDNQGVLIVGQHSVKELVKMNISYAVTFQQDGVHPMIVNGKTYYSEGDNEGRAPRTAIAQKRNGEILLIALNGRNGIQQGATYYEMQQMVKGLGTADNPVETATILDGGGSTTMYYDGKILNDPSGAFGERTVATAFYVSQ